MSTGDTLVSTVRPNLRGFARVREAPKNLVASTGFAVVSPKTTVDGSFVYQHVMTPAFSNYLEKATTGQAYPAVRPDDVASYSLALPPLREQRAIAAVLDSMDEAIERTESVIASTGRLRDALLHELLTRGVPGWHTEWKEVPGIGTIPADWEVVRLGDVADIETGGTPSRSQAEYWGGPIPWMTSGEINLRRVRSTVESITEEGMKNSNAKIFPSGTVMVAMNGQGKTRGKACLLDIKAACSQSLAAVLAGEYSHSGFLFHVLDSAYKNLRGLTGDGRSGLNLRLIRTFNFPLPPLPEQRAIAAALGSIDEAIERAHEDLESLQSAKASAADALLTGRIRV